MSWNEYPEEDCGIMDCPKCKGKPPSKDCSLCHGSGWVYVWDVHEAKEAEG